MFPLRPTTALPLVLFMGATVAAADYKPAPATVTTLQGDCRLTEAGGTGLSPKLHADLYLDATRLEVPQNGRMAMALSNGMGWSLGPSTSVDIPEYLQRPFNAERESLRSEPSISKLHLHLERGRIALAHPAPSPLSDLRVTTREGELRFRGGRCTIAVDEAGTRIFTDSGSMTFIFFDASGREFLSGGTAVLVSPQSAARGRVALRGDAVPRDASVAALSKAAESARQRVLHRAGEDGQVTSVLLAPPVDPASTE